MMQYNWKDAEGKKYRSYLEAGKGNARGSIQSALGIEDEEKRIQETNFLNRIGDSFRKIVVAKDAIISWHDDKGILYIGIKDFFLDARILKL